MTGAPPESSAEVEPAGSSRRGNPLGGEAPFDYLTDVLIPVCILGMVAAFAYFLIELRSASLAGGNQLLKYVFFWFLLAVVCISRVRAKYGGGVVAAPYAVALGGVMVLFVLRFAEWGGSLTGSGSLAGAGLTLFIVGLAWWAIHRLTDECTVEEDREDESEEGLLTSFQRRGPTGPGRRRHPGRLVILFGLAALAVFALTQPIVERAGAELAHRAFLYMVGYLLCALMLLSFTSLSGLKLYVRRRGARMDRFVAPAWLAASVVVVASILLAAALGPRGGGRSGRFPAVRRMARGFGESPQNLPVDSPVEGVRAPRGGRVLGGHGEGWGGGASPQAGPGPQAGRGAPREEGGAPGARNAGPEGGTGRGTGTGRGAGNGRGASGAAGPRTKPGSSPRSRRREGTTGGPGPEASGTPPEPRGANSHAGVRGAQQGPQQPPEVAATGGRPRPTGETAETPGQPAPSRLSPPAPRPSGGASGLRWLSWAGAVVAGLVVLYLLTRLIPVLGRLVRRALAWRPRFFGPVAALWRRMGSWFRRLSRAETGTAGTGPAELPADPFRNPFTEPGLVDRLSPGVLVEHTYHALLRYAELRGCPRRRDQTPLEFLRGLPEGVRHLEPEFTVMTRLYLVAAYTPTELPPSVVAEVRPVWDALAGLSTPQPD